MEIIFVKTQLLGLLLHDLLVRHDDGNRALELLKGNVLTALHLDEILDTIKDSQVTISIEFSDITSLEPPIRAQSTVGTGLSETITGQHRCDDERNEVLCAIRDTTSAVHSEAHTATRQFTDLAEYKAIE
ncbi:hypothetical protein HG530_002472 [Fusarium avenaceum]|nr:hypothetical protein HG530_002472 [Fusarium avenaceum]